MYLLIVSVPSVILFVFNLGGAVGSEGINIYGLFRLATIFVAGGTLLFNERAILKLFRAFPRVVSSVARGIWNSLSHNS